MIRDHSRRVRDQRPEPDQPGGLGAPRANQTHRYKELGYWTDLAQLLERGYFDFLFLADSYGYPS